MTPSCTFLSLLEILFYLLTFSPVWTWTNCSSKNWSSPYWHEPTRSQNFWSNKLISQQWYHLSQLLCWQSWLHLWLWHVFLWPNQLCIQILSFTYPRHPSSSSSSSSFYSHSACKFTSLQQTWLPQFTLLRCRELESPPYICRPLVVYIFAPGEIFARNIRPHCENFAPVSASKTPPWKIRPHQEILVACCKIHIR